MYYSSEDIDEDLKCSICKEKFVDVVKLIPDCGQWICDCCYEELKDTVNESAQFKCQACKSIHAMPANGLPEIKSFNKILKRKKLEKPLTSDARLLRSIIESFADQLRALKSFDERDYINHHCDQLDLEVMEEIDSIMRQLNEIQESLRAQIRDYRKSCLDSWSTRSAAQTEASRAHAAEVKQELDSLGKDTAEFSVKWADYFNRIDALATDREVGNALAEARLFERKIHSLQKRLKSNALNAQTMTFTANDSLFGDQSPLRRVISLTIQDDRIKEMKIQPTASHTLTGHSQYVNQVLFLPDGKLVSCSDDRTVRVWSVGNGSMLYKLEGHTDYVYSLVLLWNGWLASGSADMTIKIWDLDQRREIRTLEAHTHSVASLLLLKNGNLASYSTDDTIKIWNPYLTENNLLLTISGHGNTRWIIPFGVLSNENLVTCSYGSDDEETSMLRVWNQNDGHLINSVSTGLTSLSALLVLANDRVALSFEDGTIKIVDLNDDALSVKIKEPDAEQIFALSRFSNGNLISCSFNEDTAGSMIRVWDLEHRNLVQTITTDHTDSIYSVAISPDGMLLASGSYDRTIKLWPIN